MWYPVRLSRRAAALGNAFGRFRFRGSFLRHEDTAKEKRMRQGEAL